MPSYLEQLALRLAVGGAALPEAVRARHTNYLLAAQRADGGFAGREGASDLYYTGFGLRGLAMLGTLDGEPARRAAGFLQSRLRGQEPIVYFASLLFGAPLLELWAGHHVCAEAEGDWRTAVADTLEQLRRPDGGYAKAAEGAAGSTYQSFLVLLCRELVERPIPEPERLAAFLHSQRGEDGGFREIRAAKRSGTNPTAAAVASLSILEPLTGDDAERVIDFLAEMQTEEGGLRANTRIPIADLLSSFTGLLTLQDLAAVDAIDLAPLRKYVNSLEQSQGGFHGAEWDLAHDVEYTFYGLGCLALLAGQPE